MTSDGSGGGLSLEALLRPKIGEAEAERNEAFREKIRASKLARENLFTIPKTTWAEDRESGVWAREEAERARVAKIDRDYKIYGAKKVFMWVTWFVTTVWICGYYLSWEFMTQMVGYEDMMASWLVVSGLMILVSTGSFFILATDANN